METMLELRVRVTRDLHRRLKDKARREHRSLNAQVGYLLEQIAPKAEKAG